MPSKSSELPLRHIIENIERATSAVDGRTPATLAADWVQFYAVVRCLEIVSEASRRLEPAIRERHPEIAWRRIADAGNAYRHGYHEIEPAWIFETVVLSLPPLAAVVRAELEPFDRAREERAAGRRT